jgi:ankyrin repeat protein
MDWGLRGLDLNVQTKGDRMSPLHVAAFMGDPLATSLLISKGAMVNLRESGGRTPIFVAAERGFPNVVSLLLSAGANPNLSDDRLWTPLFIAA